MIIVNRPQNFSQHIPKGNHWARIVLANCSRLVRMNEYVLHSRGWPFPAGKRDCSTGLERAGRLRYPLPGGPDFGMPQVGCSGLRRRLCPAQIIRGQSPSRRHSQTSVQTTADQARHARFIDIRSNAFGFGVAARAEIGLIRLRQGYGGRSLGHPK
jgi:hypothetical protein